MKTGNKAVYRLLQPFVVLHIIIIAGIAGYMLLEKLAFSEAVYLTTVNITTVGSSNIELSGAGKVFTIGLLIASWATFAFVIARITQFVISGEIHQYFKNKRMMNKVSRLKDHVIVCGYGRNGRQAANILTSHGVSFVVIEKDEHPGSNATEENNNHLLLKGDATDDDTLRMAGVEKAKALITTLPLDAQNVFIVLSARSLNPSLNIISRASEASSVPKLKKAGANNVIMPDYIGGTHMATLVSKPDVVEFIDFLSGEQGHSIHMESVEGECLPANLQGHSLHEIMNWKKTGVNCIGIKNEEGRFFINPPGDTKIHSGMKIIVLGTREQIASMLNNLS